MSTNKSDIKFLNTHNLLKMYYSNARNSIEDPIFTGFTFAIDEEHSPLFYSECKTLFKETLRSPDGTTVELAEQIEEKLEHIQKVKIGSTPSSYEINTIQVKDPFGTKNGRKPGYGLWEWYNIDNVVYGATDYIYMVDKIRDGVYEQDREGVSDIGNGSPNGDPLQQKYIDELNEMVQPVREKVKIEVFFDVDKTDFWTAAEKNKVDELAKYLEEYPDTKIQIDGYASTIGNDEAHNMELSKNRIKTVKNYLITDKKIDVSRIVTENAHGQKDGPYPEEKKKKNQLAVCQVVGLSDEAIVNKQIEKKEKEKDDISDEQKDEYNELKKKICGAEGDDSEWSMSNPSPDSQMGICKAKKEELDKAEQELNNYKNQQVTYGSNCRLLVGDYINDMVSQFEEIKNATSTENRNKALSRIDELWESYLKITGFTQVEIDSYMISNSNSNSDIAEVNQDANISAPVQYSSEGNNKVSKPRDAQEVMGEWKKCFSGTRGGIDEGTGGFNVTFVISPMNIDNEIQTVRDNVKNSSNASSFTEDIIKKFIVVTKTKFGKCDPGRADYDEGAVEVVHLNDGSAQIVDNSGANKKQELEEQIYAKKFDLYGDGGSEENPVDGSLYGDLKKSIQDFNNNPVTQKNNEILELKDIQANIKTIREIEEYQNTKKTYTAREVPTTDNEKQQGRLKPKYEVPQTVYDMLGFIDGMEKLTMDYPYVLQMVNGLDEAYRKYFEIKDPYMGSGDDKISFDCLEFLDLRVSSMFDKYFNAVYDRQYRRERVPINLRRFNCSVFVHDIRNFKNSINNPNVENSGDLYLIADLALNHMSAIEFKFFDCEIVPTETGGIFESVVNNTGGDMRHTKFTFTYGNCRINFLPFEDLRRYVLNRELEGIKPGEMSTHIDLSELGDNEGWGNKNASTMGPDGNFRRWFDKSVLGNINNNDYRDYIRHDSAVAVDDHFKTTIVNTFALGSVAQKNKELTALDDALRRMVVGISASTGIPTTGVADALNIGFINPILNEVDKSAPVVKKIGNVYNSKIIDTETTDYIGKIEGLDEQPPRDVSDLGNVNK